MSLRIRRWEGFSLLEVVLAIVIAATIATLGIQHVNKPATDAQQHACDVHREILQSLTDRHTGEQGRRPSRDLRELTANAYHGGTLPVCPSTGRAYELRGDTVACPHHESIR